MKHWHSLFRQCFAMSNILRVGVILSQQAGCSISRNISSRNICFLPRSSTNANILTQGQLNDMICPLSFLWIWTEVNKSIFPSFCQLWWHLMTENQHHGSEILTYDQYVNVFSSFQCPATGFWHFLAAKERIISKIHEIQKQKVLVRALLLTPTYPWANFPIRKMGGQQALQCCQIF